MSRDWAGKVRNSEQCPGMFIKKRRIVVWPPSIYDPVCLLSAPAFTMKKFLILLGKGTKPEIVRQYPFLGIMDTALSWKIIPNRRGRNPGC